MTRADNGPGQGRAQLERLFKRQNGECALCRKPASLNAKESDPLRAVRFRVGNPYAPKETVRPKVMAHRKCAQDESDRQTKAQPIDDIRARSLAYPGDDEYGEDDGFVFSVPGADSPQDQHGG